jgi:Uncharacterized enzyme of phosphonate metabolism
LEKKRLFRILHKADTKTVAMMAGKITDKHIVTILKEPSKTLAMIKMREPVKNNLFYLGELIVCEAVVELSGIKGAAVFSGDDFEKTLDAAVIDAACNAGVFGDWDILAELEACQLDKEKKENAMHLETTVNFKSMDTEAPNDVSAFPKA